MRSLFAAARRLGSFLIYRIADPLFPGIAIPLAHRVIDRDYREYAAHRDGAVSDLATALDCPGSLEQAHTAYNQEIARREAIERKAVSLVTATGVSSGLITAAGVIGVLVPGDITDEGRIAVGSALLVPLVCLVLGFLLALHSWRVGEVHFVGPSTVRTLINHPEATRMSYLAAELIVATELNQMLTLKRVNYLSSAEQWIMRGAILIALAALTLLILATATDLLTTVSLKPSTGS
jgi:hypothetical protein